MSSESIVKDALKQGRLVIGKDKVLRMMKLGTLESVIHAANCPPKLLLLRAIRATKPSSSQPRRTSCQ